jgi:hypothetical protein
MIEQGAPALAIGFLLITLLSLVRQRPVSPVEMRRTRPHGYTLAYTKL